jgi:hypothetical protein
MGRTGWKERLPEKEEPPEPEGPGGSTVLAEDD